MPKSEVDSIEVIKTDQEGNEENIINVELNARNIKMCCAVNPEEYQKISRCSSTQEMWHKVQVTYNYKGTDEIRETKANMPTHGYELSKKKNGKCVKDLFKRLSYITNDLDALRRKFINRELVRKVLGVRSNHGKPNQTRITAI